MKHIERHHWAGKPRMENVSAAFWMEGRPSWKRGSDQSDCDANSPIAIEGQQLFTFTRGIFVFVFVFAFVFVFVFVFALVMKESEFSVWLGSDAVKDSCYTHLLEGYTYLYFGLYLYGHFYGYFVGALYVHLYLRLNLYWYLLEGVRSIWCKCNSSQCRTAAIHICRWCVICVHCGICKICMHCVICSICVHCAICKVYLVFVHCVLFKNYKISVFCV